MGSRFLNIGFVFLFLAGVICAGDVFAAGKDRRIPQPSRKGVQPDKLELKKSDAPASPAAPSASEKANDDKQVTRKAKLPPDRFQAHIEKKGGRVDFVFEDARPFAQCHASTLVETASGNLLCAWFGGTKEGADDVGIWSSTFSANLWGRTVSVAKVIELAHWNPVLFRDGGANIFLFFKVGHTVDFWETNWMVSKDDGHTWSEATELVAHDQGGRGPVKNKPIILSDGSWLAGASTEYKGWKPFADRSQDGGRTWVRSEDWKIDPGVLQGEGAIQPTIWESAPGQVHALMRTTGGFIARSDSSDGGRTWTPVYATDLPNNNSGIDLAKLEDGRLVLAYNPIAKNHGPRSPLFLAVSADNGKTWTDIAALEDEPDSEFSYPAVVRTSKGIAVSYTWKRQRIRVWQIPLASLAP